MLCLAIVQVNKWGNVVYDKHVRPQEFVKDFRTAVSGVRPRDLRKGEKLWTVQKEVAELIKGHILVGHALRNDLKVSSFSWLEPLPNQAEL
jgi:RNA exonuclease 4